MKQKKINTIHHIINKHYIKDIRIYDVAKYKNHINKYNTDYKDDSKIKHNDRNIKNIYIYRR